MYSLLLLILIWIFAWSAFNLKVKWWLKQQKTSENAFKFVYFIVWVVILYLLLAEVLLDETRYLITGFLFALLVGIAVTNSSVFSKRIVKGKYFLLSITSNILFQQSVVLISVSVFNNIFPDFNVIYFGVFFSILHLPVVFFRWVKLRYFYILLTFAGGTVFSHLITNFEYGSFFSYLIHYTVYVALMYVLKNEDAI